MYWQEDCYFLEGCKYIYHTVLLDNWIARGRQFWSRINIVIQIYIFFTVNN